MTNMEKPSNEQEERIIEIEIERLRPFKEHGADKFIVVMDALFEKLLIE